VSKFLINIFSLTTVIVFIDISIIEISSRILST